MDPATLLAGVVWDFETFPEYLDAVTRRGTRPELHRLRRSFRAAALRDRRRGLRACGHRRRDRAHGRAGPGGRSPPARPGSRRASRSRTAASTASRCRAGSPTRPRSTRCSVAAGEAGKGVVLITPGEQCSYADVYEWQPRIGRPFTYPLFASPGGKHLVPLGLHDAGDRARCRGVAAGDAASADHAVHDGRRVQPQHRHGVRRADEGRAARCASPRTATRSGGRPPRPTSRTSPMKPRWDTYEVSESARFPELEGRRVRRPRTRARDRPARRDVRARGRRGPRHPLPRLHRQRRRRRGRPTCSPRAAWSSGSRTPVRTSTSCATRRCPPTCSAPGCATAGCSRSRRPSASSTGEPADMFGFDRRGYLREGAWADVIVFDPDTVGTGPMRARAATSRPMRSASPRRSRPACATCS